MTGNVSNPATALPRARIGKNWRRYLFWLIPVAAAAIAGWIVYREAISRGPSIHILFDDAVGLQKGKSRVKYRGIDIGTVDDIALTPDNRHVKVTASLIASADNVAREGSLFWIVKPQIGLNAVTGLQTIMGGNYVTVQPGNGKRQIDFQGLPEPPPTQQEEPGRRILLLAEKLGTIKQHSPLLYHGVKVGEVHDYSLGPDAQTVQIYVNVERKYAPLVRMNSKFWNAGGVNINLGWSGLDISTQSIGTLIGGGIDFATPDSKDKEAYDGAAFRLYQAPESSWQSWFPAIKLPIIEKSTRRETGTRR